ncbi:MAG: hypothetical protein ACRDJ4_06160 [Actinomycetota bacterium]
MRRLALLLLLVVSAVLLLGSTALAQQPRDPFVPLIRADAGATATGGTTGTTTTTGGGTSTTPAPSVPQTATTGIDVEPYVLAALAAFSIGGAFLWMARVRARPLI